MMSAISKAKPCTSSWGAAICHPLPLGCALLMAVNDHLLKGAGLLPGWLTGKLSDIAGLFFFPILCFCIARAIVGASRRAIAPATVRWLATGAVVLTALGFSAANLWPRFNSVLGRIWIEKVMDPTDLVALLVLALAYAWMLRFAGGSAASPRDRVER